jgi:hypothetical protein
MAYLVASPSSTDSLQSLRAGFLSLENVSVNGQEDLPEGHQLSEQQSRFETGMEGLQEYLAAPLTLSQSKPGGTGVYKSFLLGREVCCGGSRQRFGAIYFCARQGPVYVKRTRGHRRSRDLEKPINTHEVRAAPARVACRGDTYGAQHRHLQSVCENEVTLWVKQGSRVNMR